uniref:Uncharacterized protein n=1 Tax=Crocodylus porosus TaxID=8502 RepID=A0A7M4FVM6_CROPO
PAAHGQPNMGAEKDGSPEPAGENSSPFLRPGVIVLYPFPVEKLAKKKRYIIPKIIVTGPLDEEESYTDVDNLPESKTIRDTEYYGPYNVHTKPSTIEAYQVKREMP